jgi:hypothetical protein
VQRRQRWYESSRRQTRFDLSAAEMESRFGAPALRSDRVCLGQRIDALTFATTATMASARLGQVADEG